MNNTKFGRLAFLLGVIISIMLGFVSFGYSSLLMVILGLIVGFINVTEKESQKYLLAVVALLLIGFSGLQVFAIVSTGLFNWIQAVLTSFITFVAASGAVVAIKEIVILGED